MKKLLVVGPEHAEMALLAEAEFAAHGIEIERVVSKFVPSGTAYLMDPPPAIIDGPIDWS